MNFKIVRTVSWNFLHCGDCQPIAQFNFDTGQTGWTRTPKHGVPMPRMATKKCTTYNTFKNSTQFQSSSSAGDKMYCKKYTAWGVQHIVEHTIKSERAKCITNEVK